ncbi:MAG: CoA transferase [Hydrogenophilaceae bacterium]|jgi:crotonobetainyl-CoA:carnitine CoA-transferase CaiB-like acyl-CoA transferase|nr:CoA transferase [Hydrogenophilaceae bacterium]
MTNSGAPFAGLRVIELADDIAGEFTGRLLAEMGADVIKLEPPGGSPTRAVGPFARGEEGPETSLNFWYYNSNKRSAALDVVRERAQFEALLAGADFLVITAQPAALKAQGIDLADLSARFARLIVLSVTPFGLDGPWADFKSSDLVALAAGGPLNSCGYDDHAIPPIRPGGNQGYHTATSFALIGALLALLERQKTGKGQVLDVSMHEACAVNIELANPYWFYPRVNVHRQTCRHAQPTPTQPALFRCGDDRYVYFALILSDQKAWRTLVEWMESKGMAADLVEPAFSDVAYRQARFQDVQALVECFFLVQSAEEAYHEGQARGLPIGVLNAPEDTLEDVHLRARGFFVEVDHGAYGKVRYPGASYRFSSFGEVPRTRAPHIGEHTAEVLAEIAGAQRAAQ